MARHQLRAPAISTRLSGTNRYDPVTRINVETAVRRRHYAQGEHVHRAPLALRFFEPEELATLLHDNGFTVVAQYGDYDRSPLTGESSTLVFVCTRQT